MGGFYRALYCSVGLTAASIAFFLIPVKKPPAASATRRQAYPLRDLLFLGFCASTAEWVGVLTNQYFTSSFIVLMSLTWGVQLCTIRDKTDMMWNLAISCLALVAAAAFDVVVAFSTNNFAIYLMLYLLVIFSMHFTKASFPKLAPRLALFTIVTFGRHPDGSRADPVHPRNPQDPVQHARRSPHATILWFIDRALRSVEEGVLRTTRGKCPGVDGWREVMPPYPRNFRALAIFLPTSFASSGESSLPGCLE